MGEQDAITAVILAGGQGRRMGGIDKGWAVLAGQPLIERVLMRIRPQVHGCLISANRCVERYQALGDPVVRDTLNGFPGPLAGMLAGLEAAQTDLVLALPCDVPLIPLDLAERLRSALQQHGADMAVARAAGVAQPTHALLRRELRASLREALTSGVRSVWRWQTDHHVVHADFNDRPLAFTNVNTPAQCRALARQMKGTTA